MACGAPFAPPCAAVVACAVLLTPSRAAAAAPPAAEAPCPSLPRTSCAAASLRLPPRKKTQRGGCSYIFAVQLRGFPSDSREEPADCISHLVLRIDGLHCLRGGASGRSRLLRDFELRVDLPSLAHAPRRRGAHGASRVAVPVVARGGVRQGASPRHRPHDGGADHRADDHRAAHGPRPRRPRHLLPLARLLRALGRRGRARRERWLGRWRRRPPTDPAATGPAGAARIERLLRAEHAGPRQVLVRLGPHRVALGPGTPQGRDVGAQPLRRLLVEHGRVRAVAGRVALDRLRRRLERGGRGHQGPEASVSPPAGLPPTNRGGEAVAGALAGARPCAVTQHAPPRCYYTVPRP